MAVGVAGEWTAVAVVAEELAAVSVAGVVAASEPDLRGTHGPC